MRCLLAEEFVLVGTVPSRLGSVGHTCNHNARVRGQLRMQCWEGGREAGRQTAWLLGDLTREISLSPHFVHLIHSV